MTDSTAEPLVPLPPDEPRQLSPDEIRHRKIEGGDLDAMIPFHTAGPAWRPAPIPANMFGVPHCPRCLYYHRPEEPCQR